MHGINGQCECICGQMVEVRDGKTRCDRCRVWYVVERIPEGAEYHADGDGCACNLCEDEPEWLPFET